MAFWILDCVTDGMIIPPGWFIFQIRSRHQMNKIKILIYCYKNNKYYHRSCAYILTDTMTGEDGTDKLVLMAGGHEIWLESKDISGKIAQVRLAYGHNMKDDGQIDSNRISPSVYDPEGKKVTPDLITMDGHHLLRFSGDNTGYYQAIVDMSPVILSKSEDGKYLHGPRKMYKDIVYAGAFQQMAKIIIPIGEGIPYTPTHLHGIFDMIPDSPFLTVGNEISMTLLYEGKPIPGVNIKAISKKAGKELVSGVTGSDGSVQLPVPSNGTWMFLARYNDSSKVSEDEFDEEVYVSSLVMEAR